MTDSLLEDRISKTTMELADELWEQRKAKNPKLVEKNIKPVNLGMTEFDGGESVIADVTEDQAVWPTILDSKPVDDDN